MADKSDPDAPINPTGDDSNPAQTVEVVFTDSEGESDSPAYSPLPTVDWNDPLPNDGPVIESTDPSDPLPPYTPEPPERDEVYHDPRDPDFDEWRQRAQERTEQEGRYEDIP